jgi:hypothetical protein
MRRFTIALLAALLFVGFHGTQHVFAITYAAGWNLVAGPEGSRLTGASGSIFTLQPGDTDYEVSAADSPLRGGYGYWAFFPSGGSITLTGGSNTFSVASIPGQFIMIGNPSQAVVTISGADTAFTYTPAGGYQNATAIPPGQGAWVMGSQIDLAGNGPTSAPVDSAPVAMAPAAPVQQPSGPFTLQALRAAALQQGDLPGYTFNQESMSNPPLVGFTQFWLDGSPTSTRLVVADYLVTLPSVSIAAGIPLTVSEDLARRDATNTNVRSLGAQGVGDDSSAVSYVSRLPSGTLVDWYAITFRRGSAIVTVDKTDAVGTGSLTSVVQLARIIDGRLTGSRTAGPVVALAQAPASGHLFATSGSGEGDAQSTDAEPLIDVVSREAASFSELLDKASL